MINELLVQQVRYVAFVAGVALHVLVFRNGEWDLWVSKVVGIFAVLQLGLIGYLMSNPSDRMPFVTALQLDATLGSVLIAGILSSMIVYRLTLHRLNKFPGPISARLSNFYLVSLVVRKWQLYDERERLHAKYGDFVRIGPSELSISHPDATSILYSLHTLRDHARHATRRKYWDKAFSTKALRDYEPRVFKYTDQLLDQIQATQGKPLNVSDWFNFYSFDVMGDLAFGKSFNMVKDGKEHYVLKTLHGDLKAIGIFSHIPWMIPFLTSIPIFNREHLAFWKFLGRQIEERKQMVPKLPDIFTQVFRYYNEVPSSQQAKYDLEGDTHLIVVAGSDTTAATLTAIFVHLAQDPAQIRKLREEIDSVFDENMTPDAATLAKCKYLDAVINESLRLHPAVPSGVQRVTPPEGVSVGDVFIPGNTIFQIPMHTVFRDPRNFARPTEFIPERWTTQPDLVRSTASFFPFLTGLYSCIGKQLALMELRCVTAHIVRRYDFIFAPGQKVDDVLAGKVDAFTVAFPAVRLIFTPLKL